QHLAALSKDDHAGFLTNLADAPPQDVYRVILDKVIERLKAGHDNTSSARFWIANRLNRKIVKRPASTFAYSVTPDGRRGQIVEEYMRQHGNHKPKDTAAWYLAHPIMEACREVLRNPAEAMDFIRNLAERLGSENQPLRWFS